MCKTVTEWALTEDSATSDSSCTATAAAYLVNNQDNQLSALKKQNEILETELRKLSEAQAAQAKELKRQTELAVEQAQSAERDACIARRQSRISIAIALVVAIKEILTLSLRLSN